jgi:hypothetical protein
MKYIPVVIVMTTYFPSDHLERLFVAKKACDSWELNLKYDGDVRLHIADDGSKIWDARTRFRGYPISRSWQSRHGIGASLNEGFHVAFETFDTPLVIAPMDDWSLVADIDITPWAEMLLENPSIGVIRLGPPHPGVTGTCLPFSPQWQGWVLKQDRHHYSFGHRPAIYHKRMIDYYGWFKEDCDAYECERDYNERFCSQPNGPDVVLALPHPWLHLDSVELAGIDPRRDK